MARPNPFRPFVPSPEQMALEPAISGNAINGLGEAEPRRPRVVYWAPDPDTIPHGAMQRWFYQVDPGNPHLARARADRAALLAEPMPDLFEQYAKELARWPIEPEAEEPVRHEVDCEGRRVELADWLPGSRTDEQGARAVVVLEPSDLVDKQKHYRGEMVVRHWVAHLAAHLAGGPRTTVILSKKGHVTLLPRSVEDARRQLDTLLRAWDEGMRQPLPLATKTGFAWLAKGSEEARKTFEGAYLAKGEVESNPCLKRVYPTYDALAAGEAFGDWARSLLEPLWGALHAGKKTDSGSGPKTGTTKSGPKKAASKTRPGAGTTTGSKTGTEDAGQGAGA